jgi:UDP-N-acetylmuramate-alanine ligase
VLRHLDDLEAAFVTFASRAGVAIVGIDDPGAARIASRLGNKVVRFGIGSEADARIHDISQRPDRTHARVRFRDGGEIGPHAARAGFAQTCAMPLRRCWRSTRWVVTWRRR